MQNSEETDSRLDEVRSLFFQNVVEKFISQMKDSNNPLNYLPSNGLVRECILRDYIDTSSSKVVNHFRFQYAVVHVPSDHNSNDDPFIGISEELTRQLITTSCGITSIPIDENKPYFYLDVLFATSLYSIYKEVSSDNDFGEPRDTIIKLIVSLRKALHHALMLVAEYSSTSTNCMSDLLGILASQYLSDASNSHPPSTMDSKYQEFYKNCTISYVNASSIRYPTWMISQEMYEICAKLSDISFAINESIMDVGTIAVLIEKIQQLMTLSQELLQSDRYIGNYETDTDVSIQQYGVQTMTTIFSEFLKSVNTEANEFFQEIEEQSTT